ncbi:hypothetical protein E2C01_006477 [Portunus trituberculatus]|uniref:Uncharacterized protein n=1 Tax=Portunus trituberculatus TaxID=210409 RepID=A0A5B7CYA7_PORTR|nr:hypothetical protein [Portunus trituberculatus]
MWDADKERPGLGGAETVGATKPMGYWRKGPQEPPRTWARHTPAPNPSTTFPGDPLKHGSFRSSAYLACRGPDEAARCRAGRGPQSHLPGTKSGPENLPFERTRGSEERLHKPSH